MTREEAIQICKEVRHRLWILDEKKPIWDKDAVSEAMLMAIEALEGVCFDEWCTDCKEYDTEKKCCPRFNRVIRGAVADALPSADRPKGEWIHTPNGIDRDFVWWVCSECGHKIFSETEKDRIEFHAYCGRCGAYMRGEDE